MFKEAMTSALKTEGKILGESSGSVVKSYVAKMPHAYVGIPQEFEFIVKQTKHGGKHGLSPAQMTPQQSSNILVQEMMWQKAEIKASEKLSDLYTPSLYGTTDEFIGGAKHLIMEKFAGKEIGFKHGLSMEESRKLYRAVDEMHKRGIAHTDLHGGNIFRIEGTKKIGIIDLDMANRMLGTDKSLWEEKGQVIREISKRVTGKDIDALEFSKAADKARVYAHYLTNTDKTGRWGNLHGSYNNMMQLDPKKRAKDFETVVTKILRASEESERVLGHGLKPKYTTQEQILAGVGEAFEAVTVIPGGRSTNVGFKRGGGRGYAIIDKTAVQTVEEKIKMGIKQPIETAQTEIANYNIPTHHVDLEKKIKARRLTKFRKASAESTGIGFRHANNGGRGHCKFNSTTY